MLISQKAAASDRFLHYNGAGRVVGVSSKMLKAEAATTRMKVIRSIKFLVGTHLLGGDQYIREVKTQVYGSDDPPADVIRKKNELWAKFSRPAFTLMLLENKECALLIEDLHNGWWELTRIEQDGGLSVGRVRKEMTVRNLGVCPNPGHNFGREVYVCDEKIIPVAFPESWLANHMEPGFDPEVIDYLKDVAYSLNCNALSACELMLMINVANTRIHTYKPTAKELTGVPKVLQPHYSYRLVDLFRERDRYNSLDEMVNDVYQSEKVALERRAHVVRGHFKEKNEKLFWWSPHVRCKKNAQTLGIVDKDYVVHGDKKE